MQDVLKSLVFLPQRIQALRRSSSRVGVVAALSRPKAWLPELDPADLALGYPTLKEDGNAFDDHDFHDCVKAIRLVATLIGNDTDLSKYALAYDSNNRKIPNAPYDQISLIPPIRKHTFAPEVDPAGLIDDEAEFEALNGIDWASSTFQDTTTEGEVGKDNPESSSQPEE